ncbi:LOW QUALITY PROTEIN: protein-tyrosine phosphatase-like protein [Microdochium trichocladiopsis]|uniref:Protein-tyrosine phosphatase-like protein n=1 Tax=Microdochium trichocladiopsis TaxID=1682393 RepID=A0A9P8YFA5_9PEZI|nr:LOW QUALITY PROTEIN: protein-tyrosine phosphatase-like protein [Microdochium trichocladiopsis]KAH7037832.1 LOW QUALITY PROTEIN: protein-tyrosine phosphatase-like protein [Microdochium trichocladiopsis]
MQIKKIPNVDAIRGGDRYSSELHLTDHHLIVVIHPSKPPDGAEVPSKPQKPRELYIAYPTIDKCIFRPCPSVSGRPSSIRLRGRDFVFINFNFTDELQAREAFEWIRNRTCRLGSIEKLYAFSYQPLKQERHLNGWQLYDPKAEFRRQGISTKSVDRGWRISSLNKDYAFSPTYPGMLVVPSQISDNVIKYAGAYRSRQRIPVLTYLHSLNNCSITRSSQPLVGLRGNRSIQDEKLVSACFSASATVEFNELEPPASETAEPSPASSQIDIRVSSLSADGSDTERLEDELLAAGDPNYDPQTGKRVIFGAQQSNLIVDARPTVNAVVMQAMGKGSENMDHYDFAKKAYLNIENIHVMRDSLNTVIDAIKDGDISKLPPNRELLIKSNWLKHIAGILDGSALIARQVGIRHSHVLIHCSDGWDRTSQLSALSQLMLDPFYRTIDGFIILVEKDWLSFGHMFQQRAGLLNHEKWFVVEKDGMAGSSIQPGEADGRASEAFDNALASAKRFFNRNRSPDMNSADPDVDGIASGEETPPTKATVAAEISGVTKPNEISPVFHQFLDATFQLLRQFPSRFEFNERFLRRLLYHLYAGQYGTFLWNSEKARLDARATERTRSVWDYFLSRKAEFTNSDYDATIDDRQSGRERLLLPKLSDVRWWASAFGRSDAEMNDYLDQAAARDERIGSYALAGNANPMSSSSSFDNGNRSPYPPASPKPPGLPQHNSVLTGVESAHQALTPSLKHSASADSPNAFTTNLAKLRDGVAGLDLGRGLFGGSGSANNANSTQSSEEMSTNPRRTPQRIPQELGDMSPSPSGGVGVSASANSGGKEPAALEMS